MRKRTKQMEERGRRVWALVLGGVFLFTVGALLGAGVAATWTKSEVIPAVLVKPAIGGFAPVEGSPIGNIWRKTEVTPVLLVKPGVGGFVPREGTPIGNTWRKEDVVPTMLVEPQGSVFIPLRILSESNISESEASEVGSLPAIVESRINGDFTGWDGETLFVLQNGQIWQQTSYAYRYHYAYSPAVLIYRTGGGYRMRVAGIDETIQVRRMR